MMLLKQKRYVPNFLFASNVITVKKIVFLEEHFVDLLESFVYIGVEPLFSCMLPLQQYM